MSNQKHTAAASSQCHESGDLPDGWTACEMGGVAEIIGGGTPRATDESNFAKDGYPWITPADLSGFRDIYISRGRRDLSTKGLSTSSARLLPKGAVLMSSRAPIGYVAVAANEVSTNQGFKSFVCSKRIVPKYVYYWLRYMKTAIEEMGSGTTFTEISGARCKEIPLSLAPTNEQKRIVAKVEALLERVNKARERLDRVPDILKKFRQSVLAAACSGRLTAHWREQNQEVESGTELLERCDAETAEHERSKKLLRRKTVGMATSDPPDSLPDSWATATVRELVSCGALAYFQDGNHGSLYPR